LLERSSHGRVVVTPGRGCVVEGPAATGSDPSRGDPPCLAEAATGPAPEDVRALDTVRRSAEGDSGRGQGGTR